MIMILEDIRSGFSFLWHGKQRGNPYPSDEAGVAGSPVNALSETASS